jgi:glutathione S-transferase
LCSDANSEVVQQNVEAALQFATAKFALGKEELAAAFAQAIVRAGDKPEAADLILAPCLAAADRDFVRALLAHLPETLAAIPARWLLDTLVQKCATALLPTRRG